MNRSLISYAPRFAGPRRPEAVRGLSIMNEAVDKLPIETPQDNWSPISSAGVDYIQRTFELGPAETKMLVCDILDAQQELGHEVAISIEGGRVTVRSTTHEYGEPTERDREIARYIDTSYDEVRRAYR